MLNASILRTVLKSIPLLSKINILLFKMNHTGAEKKSGVPTQGKHVRATLAVGPPNASPFRCEGFVFFFA